MNAKEWIDAYAEQAGIEGPSKEEFGAILDLAAEAAHASERVAAPAACWVAAKAGLSLDDALAAAREVSAADSDRQD
jgi:Domain of unknown function (DUF6457)